MQQTAVARTCLHCGGPMPKVGWERNNGAQHHGDGLWRKYHKKCLKAVRPMAQRHFRKYQKSSRKCRKRF
jgi:hypothetical protein